MLPFAVVRIGGNPYNRPRHRPDLFRALETRNQSEIHSILKSGATWEHADDYGQTVLHMLVKKRCNEPHEQKQVIKLLGRFLSKNKVKVNVKCDAGKTALHLAARNGMIDVVDYLIGQGADLHAKDARGCGLVHHMIEGEFEKYFESSRKVSSPDEFRSLYRESVHFFNRMLSKNIEIDCINKNLDTPLHIAVKRNLLHLLPILLEHSRKVTFRDKENKNVLQLFIANKFSGTFSAISTSCYDEPLITDILKMMLTKDYGACVKQSYNGGNLLHLLSLESSTTISSLKLEKVIGLLIRNGCNVNSRDKDGMTPLHLAVQSGRNAVIEELIKYHANVDARELSVRRLTPLQMAVDRQLDDSINTLVKLGADVNAKDSSGKTALHLAMKFKTSIVTKLLRLGAHVDVEDDQELLPLHYAIKNQNGVALAELLNYGADVNDIDTYRELVRLKDPGLMLFGVLEHWIKMKAAGLTIAPGYRTHADNDTYQELYQDCLKEIETLKAFKIVDSISLYRLLHMDCNFRCAYTASKPFKDLIESTILKTKFPKYHVLILASYHEAVARQPLLEPAKRAWCELTKIALPDVCVYRILAYLTNRDLRVIVEGLKDRSFRKPCNLLLNVKGLRL